MNIYIFNRKNFSLIYCIYFMKKYKKRYNKILISKRYYKFIYQ